MPPGTALQSRVLLGCPELSSAVLGPAAVLQLGSACTASSWWSCSCIDTANLFVLVGHTHIHIHLEQWFCVYQRQDPELTLNLLGHFLIPIISAPVTSTSLTGGSAQGAEGAYRQDGGNHEPPLNSTGDSLLSCPPFSVSFQSPSCSCCHLAWVSS